MTRYRIDLAYDGRGFHGWAAQEGLRTVQGELEGWITRILRLDHPAVLTVAGRTDAGVHARGQVAHVDLPSPDMAEELTRRLRRALPDDLMVRAIATAPDGFDARFSAIWRRYIFRLADPLRDPLHRGMVVSLGDPLDVATMNAAARSLLGLHDFAAFCKRREGATTIREVLEAGAARVADGELVGTVAVTLRADAFCHSMVRSVVGALVAVGTGRRDVEWLTSLVDRSDRANEVAVLPPHGLVLEEVGYPAGAELAARQLISRARRDSDRAQTTPTDGTMSS